MLNSLLIRLLLSYYRLQSFKKNSYTPTCVVDNENTIFDKLNEELMTEQNFDGKKYLSTPEGIREYKTYIDTYAQNLSIVDRCGRCYHYSVKMTENDTIANCVLYDDLPKTCSVFNDTGKTYSERLLEAILKCKSCNNFKTQFNKETNLNDTFCVLNFNCFNCDLGKI